MTSTSSPMHAEPLFDDGAVATAPHAAPTVTKAEFGGVEETLAKLAQQAASDTRDARPRTPASDMAADLRVSPSSAAQSSTAPTLGPATLGSATIGPATPGRAPHGAATLGAADLSTHVPLEQPSSGTRRTLVRVAILVVLGAAALWAWRSYGGPAREVIAAFVPRSVQTAAQPAADLPPIAPNPAPTSAPSAASTQAAAPAAAEMPPPPQAAPAAPSADHQQIDAMARDVAALRETVAQLTTGQEQLKGEIARLQAEKAAAEKRAAEKAKKRVVHHTPPADHPKDAFDPALHPTAPGAPRTIGSVVQRRPALPPSTAPVSTVSSLPPPPGAPAEVRRPPAPVPGPQY